MADLLMTLTKVNGNLCSPTPQQKLVHNGAYYDKDPESPSEFRVCQLLPIKSNGVVVDWDLSVSKGGTCMCNLSMRKTSPGQNAPPDGDYCLYENGQTTCGETEASIVWI